MAETIIDIQNVSKSFQAGVLVLNNISLAITEGSFVTIIGPSGCGKTTLLRLMNGMTQIDTGSINVLGKDLNNWNKIKLRRKIGYAIQQGGLFPHLSVKENIAFVLNISKEEPKVIDKRIDELALLMNFDERQLTAYPAELSGGQQQRVGVARALASRPQIILMDEPFGALDNITRKKLQTELTEMHQRLNNTFVMVTHDLQEAFNLGTQVVIMNKGIIEQYDTPVNIKNAPANNWVKEFVSN